MAPRAALQQFRAPGSAPDYMLYVICYYNICIVCICIYIYIYTYIHIYVCIYIYISLSIYIYIYTSIYLSISLSLYIYIYIYTCMYHTRTLFWIEILKAGRRRVDEQRTHSVTHPMSLLGPVLMVTQYIIVYYNIQYITVYFLAQPLVKILFLRGVSFPPDGRNS